MAANYNFSIIQLAQEGNALIYKDAQNNSIIIPSSVIMATAIQKMSQVYQAYIAPEYEKTIYQANSLVFHNQKLYYNPNAINTAENWTAAHWTATTVADYIKLMTTT